MHVRLRRQSELHAEGNGEEEDRERPEPTPRESPARAGHATERTQISAGEIELPSGEPEGDRDGEHAQRRENQQGRLRRNDLVPWPAVGPGGEARNVLDDEEQDES